MSKIATIIRSSVWYAKSKLFACVKNNFVQGKSYFIIVLCPLKKKQSFVKPAVDFNGPTKSYCTTTIYFTERHLIRFLTRQRSTSKGSTYPPDLSLNLIYKRHVCISTSPIFSVPFSLNSSEVIDKICK